MQPFDENAYRPRVQSMISREGSSADAELAELGEAIRYQVLKANCDRATAILLCSPGSRSMSPICSPPTSAAGGSAPRRTSA